MMKYPYNLHTHTVFCDGKNTPAEMAEAAFAQGFKTLGFSGHSVLPWYENWPMTKEGEKEYIFLVNNLKKEYEGKMEIVLGLELDSQSVYSKEDLDRFSYIIGSVHAAKAPDGKGYYADCDENTIFAGISAFGGIESFCEKYFSEVVLTAQKESTDILGHFDLIVKFNERVHFLDENAKWYRDLALSAADEVSKTDAIVEVNTGAIARNCRSTPYPSEELIRRFNENGTRLILSSDAHSDKKIDCCFTESLELLKKCGINKLSAYENGEFVEVKI